MGRSAGLDVTQLLDVLAAGLAGSRAMDVKRAKYESEDFTPGGSAINQLKDLRIAQRSAAELGYSLPVTGAVADAYQELVDSGRGNMDHSGVILTVIPNQPT